MTTLKKALSIVLCLAMLMGTFAVCVTADDTTGVKSYSTLVSENTGKKFVYFGSDIFENFGEEGQALTDGNVVPGQTLHVKQYVKTNCNVGTAAGTVTMFSFMFDGAIFEIVADSWTKYNTNPAGSYAVVAGAAKTSTTSTSAKSYYYGKDDTSPTGYKPLKAVTDTDKKVPYSLDEVKGWTILEYTKTGKDMDTDIYQSDNICFEFDVKVKDDAKANTTGRSLAPATIYTSYQACTQTQVTNAFVLDKTSTNKKVYDAWYNADSEHKFTVKKEKVAVKFVVGEDETLVEGAPLAEYPDGSVPVLGDAYIGWADNDGNIVTDITVFPDDDTTYTAVEKGTKVKITLNPGEGATIDGPTEFDVEVGTTFNVADYNANAPVYTSNENLVYEWDNDNFAVDSLNPVTVTAIWSGEFNVKVMSLAGEFVTAFSLKGEPGTSLSFKDIAQINENYDAICAAVNYRGEGVEPGDYEVSFNFEGIKEMPVEEISLMSYLYTDPENASSIVLPAVAATMVYGEGTPTDIYIPTLIQYTINKYKPEVDDEGVYIEDSWILDKTSTVEFKSIFGEGLDHTYRVDTGMKYSINDVSGSIGDIAIDDPTYGVDTYVCEIGDTATDGNGADIKIAEGNLQIKQSNADEGTQIINVYPKLSKKLYGVVININGKDMVSKDKVEYGTNATVADFDAIDNYKISDMIVDAGNAYYGKKLTALYLSTDTEKTSNLLDEGKTITFDVDTISANLKNGTNNIVLVPEWEDNEYTIEFFYMDKSGEWKSLFTNTYVGDKPVSFNDIPADLQKKINDEMPEGKVLESVYGITDAPGAKAKYSYTSGKAFAADKMKAYVAYKFDQITYFHVLNENAYGKDEEGNSTAAVNTNYEQVVMNYGTVLYNPDYDPESGESKPVYNALIDGTAVESMPDTVSVEKEDGTVDIKDPKGDLTATKRAYRNCEYIGYKVYYVEGNYTSFADLPSKDQWKEGFNATANDYTLKNTVIFERQWKADKDFLFRVYGVNETNEKKIYMGLGKDFSKYYWKGDRVVESGDGVLVALEGYFAMGFIPKLDNFDIQRFFDITMWQEVSLRIDVLSMSKDILNPAEWGKILAAAFTAIKNLL